MSNIHKHVLEHQLRKCNGKRDSSPLRINHFLERQEKLHQHCHHLFPRPPPSLGNGHSKIMMLLAWQVCHLDASDRFPGLNTLMFLGWLFYPPDNCWLDDNPYLVTGPFIMGVLSILGDDVFQFFRQGEAVKRGKK